MVVKSKAYEELRIRRIRQKYGANIFHTWGERGGSPYLLALRRGDKLTIKHRKSK